MKFSQFVCFASGLVSASLVAIACQPPLSAQVVHSDELPQLSPGSLRPNLPVTQVTQDLENRAPAMQMQVQGGSVSVRLVNNTTETIAYEALGDTEPRSLEADGEIILQNIQVPATVSFSYKDIQKNRQTRAGLTKAELRADTSGEMLNVVVSPTDELDSDVSVLTVESSGRVFVF